MKRGRLPLTALRSFEVAARLGSFTLGAQELFVSQAAISRQIRDLEATLGKPLFERRHRGVDLTPDGATLLGVLTRAFDEVDACLDAIGDRPPLSDVTISVEPSFASCWLVPHIADFQRRHPQIDVSFDADARLVEFRTHQAQLAIRYSATARAWPRTDSRHLADVDMVAVISRRLHQAGPAIVAPTDLLRHGLLHEDNRDMWQRWFAASGHPLTEPVRGSVYADGGLILQAVLRDQGVALLDKILVGDDLRSGRLVQPFDVSVAAGAYWLVARDFQRLSEPAKVFADWLESMIRPPGERAVPKDGSA